MEEENGEEKEAEGTEVKERATSGEAKGENMEEKVCGRVHLEEE